MTSPQGLWIQQDAAQIVRSALRKKTDSPAMFRDSLPDKWTSEKSPVVTVVSDGTPRARQSWTTETVRITVHAKDKPSARRIMAIIDGMLQTPLFIGVMGKISPSTGIITLNDSRVGGGTSSATYSVSTSKFTSI